MIPDEESLEFLIEHLKYMIQEQPDRKIEKISDLTEILSDFMSTFLVVVDALISSSQRRFGVIEHKLNDFEDLLLNASIKGLSGLSELSHTTEKKPSKEPHRVQQPIPRPTSTGVPPPPPPTKVPTEGQIPITESTHPPEEKPIETISDDMEVEDLAALAFKQREKETAPSTRTSPAPLGAVSLKTELMQELKKKFGSEKFKQIDSK
ncbi:MAG: hypothetical protein JSW11_03540 [Candidatus Heimdallarchaeota archaeon]|nr:MAG: hypothetical protein JSW11_03540 [Candidatus Heimdallarchaeota archaeon]